AHHDQHINLTRIHVVNQVTNGLGVLNRINFNRISVVYGLADVAQGGVHCVGQRVNCWCLEFSGYNQALATMAREVGGYSVNPFLLVGTELSPTATSAHFGSESASDLLDF